MKRTLAFLAIAALAVAPFGFANAEDHAAPAAEAAAEAAPAAEAPATEASAAYEVTLKDGTTKVSIEGDNAFVVAADGTKTAAPDGDHVLADDTTMTVAAGVITAGKPAAPAAAEEAPAAGTEGEAHGEEAAH